MLAQLPGGTGDVSDQAEVIPAGSQGIFKYLKPRASLCFGETATFLGHSGFINDSCFFAQGMEGKCSCT